MSDQIDDPCAAFLEKLTNLMTSWSIAAGAPQDAPDIVQEAKAAVLCHKEEFMQRDASWRAAALKKTVTHKTIDARRYRSRGKRDTSRTLSLNDLAAAEPPDDGTTPSARAALDELRARVLDRLPKEDRLVCDLSLVHHRTPTEIADELKITLETVGDRLASGLRRVGSELKRLIARQRLEG